MHPSPAIIELGECVSSEEVYELEVVVSLSKDKKIINFVDQSVSYVDCVEEDDEPAEKIAKISKPMGHEIVMGVAISYTVVNIDHVLSEFVLKLGIYFDNCVSIRTIGYEKVFSIRGERGKIARGGLEQTLMREVRLRNKIY
jgi:hypothetical protein